MSSSKIYFKTTSIYLNDYISRIIEYTSMNMYQEKVENIVNNRYLKGGK